MSDLDYSMHIRIPAEVYKRARKIQHITGESMTSIVRMALLEKFLNVSTFVGDIIKKVDLERTNVKED